MSSPIYVHLGAQREFSKRRSDIKPKKKRFCDKWRIQGDRFFDLKCQIPGIKITLYEKKFKILGIKNYQI